MTPSPLKTTIREGRPEDAERIAEYNRLMAWETEKKELDASTVLKGVQAGLAQPGLCRYFVANTDGLVVGQAMVTYEWSDWRNGELWWIQSVYVHPDHRRRGIFRELFQHILSIAQNHPRVRGLRLYVETDNQIGMDVYRSLGMVHAGYHVYEKEF